MTVKSTGVRRAAKVIVKKESQAKSIVSIEEEIEIMKALHHRNVVLLYDAYDATPLYYLVRRCKRLGGAAFCASAPSRLCTL